MMAAVVAQGRQSPHRHAAECCCGGVVTQDGTGQFAVEGAHVAGEFGEAEIDQAVQVPHAIDEILQQALAQLHQFAQFLGEGVGQGRGRWALLGGEAGDGDGVDGVGLGALEIDAGEAMGAQGIEQGDAMSGRGQDREQVLPIVSGRLHGDQHLARRAEQRESLLKAQVIFAERGRFQLHHAVRRDHGQDVSFGCDVDAGEAHTTSWRRRKSGASEPVLESALVHARTGRCRPRDTVRTLSTGRGRQTHSRGLRLQRRHGDPLPVPSMSILLGVSR